MVLVAFEPAPKVDPALQTKDKRLEETVERMATGMFVIFLNLKLLFWQQFILAIPTIRNFLTCKLTECFVSCGFFHVWKMKYSLYLK